MREGKKTTEFWATLAVLVAATLLVAIGKITAEAWLGVAVGNGGIYTAARAFTKARTAAYEVPLPEPLSETVADADV